MISEYIDDIYSYINVIIHHAFGGHVFTSEERRPRPMSNFYFKSETCVTNYFLFVVFIIFFYYYYYPASFFFVLFLHFHFHFFFSLSKLLIFYFYFFNNFFSSFVKSNNIFKTSFEQFFLALDGLVSTSFWTMFFFSVKDNIGCSFFFKLVPSFYVDIYISNYKISILVF